MTKKSSSYTKQEKENFALIATNIILGKMLSALRAKDQGPPFYIQEIKAQTEPEKICEVVADTAGKICSEIYSKGLPDGQIDDMYSFAEQKGWEIYKERTTINNSIKEFFKNVKK